MGKSSRTRKMLEYAMIWSLICSWQMKTKELSGCLNCLISSFWSNSIPCSATFKLISFQVNEHSLVVLTQSCSCHFHFISRATPCPKAFHPLLTPYPLLCHHLLALSPVLLPLISTYLQILFQSILLHSEFASIILLFGYPVTGLMWH